MAQKLNQKQVHTLPNSSRDTRLNATLVARPLLKPVAQKAVQMP